VGPNGRVTVHTQPSQFTAAVIEQRNRSLTHHGSTHVVDESVIDPALRGEDLTGSQDTAVNFPPAVSTISSSADATIFNLITPGQSVSANSSFSIFSTPTPASRALQPTSAGNLPPPAPRKPTKVERLADEVEKAKATVKSLPQKRSFEDRMADMNEEHLKQVRNRDAQKTYLKSRRLACEEDKHMLRAREQIIELFKLGVYDKEEVKQELDQLERTKKMKGVDKEIIEEPSAYVGSYDWDNGDELPSSDLSL
jgi:hypothetical protein